MKLVKSIGFITLFTVLLTQLSGCGYQVKQGGAVGFSSAVLTIGPGTQKGVKDSLIRQLKAADIDLQSSNPKVEIILGVTDYSVSKISSISPGKITTEFLKMSQRFKVMDAVTGKELSKGKETVSRDRKVDHRKMTAGQNELHALQHAMRQQLGKQVFNSIQRNVNTGQ
jgi:outer membrane lipopolysaccharide assembly protein LptE/RlpB